MDIPKFVSLIDRKALFFLNANQFSERFDQYEGYFTNATIQSLINKTDDLVEKQKILDEFKGVREI